MTDPVAVLQAMLRPYPQLQYDAGADWIRIHPADATGFTVEIRVQGAGAMVRLDGWHDQLDTVDEALELAERALTGVLRLAVWQRGSTRYRWQAELLQAGQWVPAGSVGLLFYPFWRRSQMFHLRNQVLKAA